MGDSSCLEDRIASLVHTRFNSLPKRSKPAVRPNGKREWIPLSGIVLATGETLDKIELDGDVVIDRHLGENTTQENLTCIALATGAKCLSASEVANCNGLVLHDTHAEILALRAFNHWVLEECKALLMHEEAQAPNQQPGESRDPGTHAGHKGEDSYGSHSSPSRFLQWRARSRGSIDAHSDGRIAPDLWPPFEFRHDVDIWMYCTCAPCGDASMELCMAAQEDPTPWETIPPDISTETDPAKRLLDGRAYFSILGVVRRKPSRADAEPTLSKSCSDKLAVKQVTSLLSFPTSLLVAPTRNSYLKYLLLPEEEISRVACDRCFGGGDSGRLKQLKDRTWNIGGNSSSEYAFRPFSVRYLRTESFQTLWEFAKPKDPDEGKNYKPGNISAVWTAASSNVPLASPAANLTETLINGVKQGYHVLSPNGRKASALSRARMWELLRNVIQMLPASHASRLVKDESGWEKDLLTRTTYALLKHDAGSILHTRNQALADVQGGLGNWIQNCRDEDWGLEVLKQESVKKPKG